MLIVQAQAMGMCFGVEDALKLAHSIENPRQLTVLGEVVHNRQVQQELLDRGYASQPEDARAVLPESPGVLVTAHGISHRYRQRLTEAGKQIVDTTCPLVRRVHKTAAHLVARGFRLVLVGKLGHVEVLGITEDYPDTVVVPGPEQVSPGLGSRLAVIAQTTTPPDLFEHTVDRIKALHPDSEVRVADTICRPTRERQQAINTLLSKVEAVVVVGGANSNNTLRLVEQARARRLPCWRVENASELEPSWFEGLRVVGLTAGTSTPASAIAQVHRRLLQFAQAGAPNRKGKMVGQYEKNPDPEPVALLPGVRGHRMGRAQERRTGSGPAYGLAL